MRVCPNCQRSYRDETLNFCLEDGTPLVSAQLNAEEPTRILDPATAPTLWQPAPTASAATIERPETRYAKSGKINIAYQVLGDGPIDIVYVPGWVTHLEYGWEAPLVASFYQRLSSFSRLILFDKRGTGLSDQTTDLPTLEQRMDDVRAVMEAADSSRAVIFGMSEGGSMSVLFAATYPDRTLALVTFGIFATRVWDADYPWAPTPDQRQKFFEAIENEWGGPIGVDELAPSLAGDPRFRDWWATYQRRSASPRAALDLARMNTSIDIRNVLPAIRVPTLVLHRTGDLDASIEEGRYIAARIHGAKFVELAGQDHLIYAGDQNSVLDEVESFIKALPHESETEAVLATVLYAQITNRDSEKIIAGGNDANRFYSLAKRETDWFRGKTAKAEPLTFVATFDGPARAVRCASAITDAARRAGIETRIGIHTGLCEQSSETISGAAVVVSASIAALAAPFEVLVSSSVKDLVSGAGLAFEGRGECDIDNLGRWKICVLKRDN